MKPHFYLILLVTTAALGQPALQPPPPTPTLPARALKGADPYAGAVESPKLTKFNLDFPGGNPKQLVAAIEKATGRPLNVVIPDEYASESISALRMTQVTVPDLFKALEQASLVTIPYRSSSYYGGGANGGPSYSYQQIRTSLTFQTSGKGDDDSIWYFRGREKAPDPSIWGEKPTPPLAKTSRFYALTPYLEQGLKVEDITTAIQTGWKMLGDKETPSISFHKETKLLIAVGEPGKLETIDAVLKALDTANQTIDPATGLPTAQWKSIEKMLEQSAQPAPMSSKTNHTTPKPSATSDNKP